MIEVFDQHGNKMFEVSPTQGGADKDGEIDETSSQEVKKIISEGRAILENMKKKGSISGKMSEYLTKLLEVKIPWTELVEKAIKTNTILEPNNRSWKQLNKFYSPIGITLPGYAMEESNEGIGTLIISVDTSGSISKTILKKFSYVIEQSMKYFKSIKVLVHDVSIHQEKDFEKDTINQFYDFIKNEGYKGRGGTSHKYVFDKIEDLWNDDPDDLSMYMSLTDMYSDVENIYTQYSFIKNNLPTVFLIIDGRTTTLDKSIGTISQILIE